MPNWERIEILRDHLTVMVETEYHHFDMKQYSWPLTPGKSIATAEEVRRNGPECGSAGCFCLFIVVLFANPTATIDLRAWSLDEIPLWRAARDYLELSQEEADFMFLGSWLPYTNMEDITKDQAVKYLTKVLDYKMIEVRLK